MQGQGPSPYRFSPGADGTLTVAFAGHWALGDGALPGGPRVVAEAERQGAVRRVVLDGRSLGRWDTSLLLVVNALTAWCRERGIPLAFEAMPEGVGRLVRLASAVAERTDTRRGERREPLLERVGRAVLASQETRRFMLAFIGETALGLGRFAAGRARYRRGELWVLMEQCGPQALGIVTTISVLVGAILAFVGAIQLRLFGAEIYVADLVGIGMVIEMGALMTGIILAGRTGAAFAAQLGTMQVSEEIDALRTFGIPPMDYLVVPRIVALAAMTPLLVVYADVLGILGGAAVAIAFLDIPPALFLVELKEATTVWYCVQGLVKGWTFGILVAVAGCLRGMQCGRSAPAVGDAATSAMVTSIVLIVVADAVWTFLFLMGD